MTIIGVYEIRNLTTGKAYFGSSRDVSLRLVQHKFSLKLNQHHSFKLQAAWNKYGEAAFQFALVEETEEDKLLEREQFCMDAEQTYTDNGYNVRRVAHSTYTTLEKGVKIRGQVLVMLTDMAMQLGKAMDLTRSSQILTEAISSWVSDSGNQALSKNFYLLLADELGLSEDEARSSVIASYKKASRSRIRNLSQNDN
jgi:group I intron endonuclease